MANQFRVQAPAAMSTAIAPAFGLFCMPVAVMIPLPLAGVPFQCVCTAHSTAPAPPPADKEKSKANKTNKTDTAAPAAAARTQPGAGLPAPLVALLRGEDGPFLANEVFSAPPTQSLDPVDEQVPAPEWHTITRGRFVGVVDQYALAELAISGVGGSARKAYSTQSLALNAFNQALTWGGVQVL